MYEEEEGSWGDEGGEGGGGGYCSCAFPPSLASSPHSQWNPGDCATGQGHQDTHKHTGSPRWKYAGTHIHVYTHKTRDICMPVCWQGRGDSVPTLMTHRASSHIVTPACTPGWRPPASRLLCSLTPEPMAISGGLEHSSVDPSNPFPAQLKALWASALPLPGSPGDAAPKPSLGLQFPTLAM